MSKNTGTSELINYFDLGVNGDVGIAGSLTIDTIASATTEVDSFLVSDSGVIKFRTGGLNGTSGTSGTSGTDGTSGTNGTSGSSGTSGTSGTSGSSGSSGSSGTSGTSGSSGSSGATQAFSNGLTMNNSGSGDASGTIYNGSTSITISHNTIGALALAGGTMTGQIILKEGTNTSDYSKGLRFPNDPYGGTGDTSGLRLYAETTTGAEAQVLELYVTNDAPGASVDRINLAAPNNDLVTVNGNKIWNSGNLSSPIYGTGTTNFLPKFTGGTTIGNSQVFDNGTNVGIGTVSPTVVNFGRELVVSNLVGETPEAQIVIQGNRTTDTNVGGFHFYNDNNFLANISGAREGANNSGAIKFSTNNVGSSGERMRINPNGNVGIGTNNPGEQLTLSKLTYPTVKLIETTDNASAYFQYHSEANEFRLLTISSHPLIFSTTDTERMRITSGGNVLIGGTVVQNDSANRGNLTINGTTSILNLSTSNTNAGYLYHGGTDLLLVNAKNGATLFYTNDIERVRITSTGVTQLKQASGQIALEIFDSTTSTGALAVDGNNLLIGGQTGKGLVFTTNNLGQEKMRITVGGNVLINTTTDNGTKLQVNGGITVAGTSALADNQLRIRDITDQNHAIVNNTTINGPLSYGFFGSGLGYTEGGAANITLMTYKGNVLIGTTTNGSSKLRVVGLPTSSAGLSSGDIWNDGGTLKIV